MLFSFSRDSILLQAFIVVNGMERLFIVIIMYDRGEYLVCGKRVLT
jgi:hypothetical protein